MVKSGGMPVIVSLLFQYKVFLTFDQAIMVLTSFTVMTLVQDLHTAVGYKLSQEVAEECLIL